MKSTFNPVRRNGRGRGWGVGAEGAEAEGSVVMGGEEGGGGIKECSEGGGMLIEGAEERKEMEGSSVGDEGRGAGRGSKAMQ